MLVTASISSVSFRLVLREPIETEATEVMVVRGYERTVARQTEPMGTGPVCWQPGPATWSW